MTVEKLIEILEGVPPELEVTTSHGGPPIAATEVDIRHDPDKTDGLVVVIF